MRLAKLLLGPVEIQRALQRALVGAVVIFAVLVGPALAVDNDQATWTKATTCTNNNIQVTYWRTPSGGSTCYRNNAGDRDGDLRTAGDTYQDLVPVGNLNGQVENTHFLYNFLTINVKMWTGTCYSGASTTVLANLGNSVSPTSSNNLRSLAKSTVTGCGQP